MVNHNFNSVVFQNKLSGKRDNFSFHIVDFPFLSSDILSGLSYGVYTLQLIRNARCCTYYDDFGYRQNLPVDRLLSHSCNVIRQRTLLQKIYGRYSDLVAEYKKSVRDKLTDSFPFYTVDLKENYNAKTS